MNSLKPIEERGGLKTPLSYYGGKQNLVSEIVPLVPAHKQYGEVFCGGAAVLWAKRPSEHEFINDFDGRVFNFWDVLRTEHKALSRLVEGTLNSERIYQQTKQTLRAGLQDNRVEFAWAYWVQTQMSFGKKPMGGFAFDNSGSNARSAANKREAFPKIFSQRLRSVEIFNRDAIDLIRLKDTKDTFFYFDPPYAESDCGHYEKSKEVYYRLLEVLPSLKASWLMSSYPSADLDGLRQQHGYQQKEIVQDLSVNSKQNLGRTKTECLTWNYELIKNQLILF